MGTICCFGSAFYTVNLLLLFASLHQVKFSAKIQFKDLIFYTLIAL